MKYLLLIVLLALLFFILGVKRARPPLSKTPEGQRGQGAKAGPQDMVRCQHCGLHLPHEEALPGAGGLFCGPAHRTAYEEAHPLNAPADAQVGRGHKP